MHRPADLLWSGVEYHRRFGTRLVLNPTRPKRSKHTLKCPNVRLVWTSVIEKRAAILFDRVWCVSP